MTTTASGVTVEKPWYESKKIWLATIGLGLALTQSLSGRWTDVSPEQLVARIAETATWLLPLVAAIQSIAHVDGKTRAAALVADALRTASSLDDAGEKAAPFVNPS